MARDVVAAMGRVRRAETVYARYHFDLSRDGASFWHTVTAQRRRREARLAFDELVREVRGLRTSWELYCLHSTAARLTSRAALRLTVPGLFDDASRGELRGDTTFSNAAAASARDIAYLFKKRLESGHC